MADKKYKKCRECGQLELCQSQNKITDFGHILKIKPNESCHRDLTISVTGID